MARRIYDNGVYRDMTEEEIEELQKSQEEQPEPVPELTNAEIAEIEAEHEYRLCLLEMGVSENDL